MTTLRSAWPQVIHDPHVGWAWHQLIADALALVVVEELARAAPPPPTALAAGARERCVAALPARLSNVRVPACEQPLTWRAARDGAARFAPVAVDRAVWRFGEDAAGKPGWIAEGDAAGRITFAFNATAPPHGVLTLVLLNT